MNSPGIITDFKIYGLRNKLDIHAKLENNTLVMVGENGSGKTTFLRMLFYFLSGRWSSLRQFEFQSISIILDGQERIVKHRDLSNVSTIFDSAVVARLPIAVRRRIKELIDANKYDEATSYLSSYAPRYGISRSAIFDRDLFSDKNHPSSNLLGDLHDAISKSLNSQILYLPTYRRIERELSSIVRGVDPDDLRRSKTVQRQPDDADDYVELVEFGMGDVKQAIDDALSQIQLFASVDSSRLTISTLGDIVNRNYQSSDAKEIFNTSSEKIEAVLNRIDETVLTPEAKNRLRDTLLKARTTSDVLSEHEQIVYYYFSKLLSFQKAMDERENNIKSFCELCSTYIVDKNFIYENSEFSFRIESKRNEGEIQLSDLSSGEKQIVSLFSHLYLSGRERFFVLIDEPELSLSVPWQRRFLEDIRNGSFCSGLVAVTHSPFIYDNSLRKHTHALGEFVSGPDWGNIV